MAEVFNAGGRIEIESEESDYAAETKNYRLKLKQVKSFFLPDIKGWMGNITYKNIASLFTSNTHMYETRQEAVDAGREMMIKLQKEFDEEDQKIVDLIKQHVESKN